MIQTILLIVISWYFSLHTSCTEKEIDDAAVVKAGICDISKNSDGVVCLNFAADFAATTADTYCSETLFPIYTSSVGANGRVYAASSVGNGCSELDDVGSCAVASGELIYYSPTFNASSAESDCTSTHTGVWTP